MSFFKRRIFDDYFNYRKTLYETIQLHVLHYNYINLI